MAAATVQFKCSTTTPMTGQEVEITVTALAHDPGTKIIVGGDIQAPGNIMEKLTFHDADNVYKTKYAPKVVGRHCLTVNYCGMPCANSPTMLMVSPRGELKTTLVGGPKFSNPHDIVKLGADLIITNKGSHEVLITDQSGFLKNKFITPVLSNTQTFEPYALAVHENTIVVSDLENRRVIRYNKDWVPLKQIGEEHLYRPTGVAVDEDNKIFVADDQLSSIRVFDSDGQLVKTIGWEGSKPGELNKPWFIAFNSKRQLVVADCRNCRIQIFNAGTGELVDCFRVQLNGNDMNVRGLDVDKHDIIYITAITNTKRPFMKTECAMAYTMEGEFLGRFGSGFFYPRAIRIIEGEDGESNAYVVDGAHHRIMVYKL